MSWIKDETVCSEENCWRSLKARGWCKYHYQKYYKSHIDYKTISTENLRKHPLYIIWWQRKESKVLCEEWLNFQQFVHDITPKPKGNYFLVRLTNAPYGPDNFKWQEHLKRKEGESKKEWYARKWAARQLQNPGAERARNFKRKYGITIGQYNEMLEKQNFICAICNEKETSIDGKTGALRKLAIDHNHKTNELRELLCWRCNSTIGKINEDINLLKKMIVYLEKHNGFS